MLKNDTSTISKKDTIYEETLNGAPVLSVGMNSEMTTEESIDYDSNEANRRRVGYSVKSHSDETHKNTDYDTVTYEKRNIPLYQIPPFVAEQQTLEPPLVAVQQEQQQKQKQPPSVYSTFMNRLKYSPSIVDLNIDNRPKPTGNTLKYSHNPFDLAAVIQNGNSDVDSADINQRQTPSQPAFTSSHRDRPNAAAMVAVTAATTNTDDNAKNIESTSIVDSSAGHENTNRHQLQIGINCYLRNLVNKQQFIICDNA